MDKETKRHDNIINKIERANNKKELPSISNSNILDELVKILEFNGKKIEKINLKNISKLLDEGYSFKSEIIKRNIVIIIYNNFENIKEEDITNKYIEIINNEKINNILYEIQLKEQKIIEFENNNKLEEHNKKMKKISYSYAVKDLPKVGLSELNKELLSCVNSNNFNKNIKTSEIKELTDAYLNKESFEKIKKIIENICNKEEISLKNKTLMKEQIIASLIVNNNIDYIIEEIEKKEKRKPEIYREEHEYIMDSIKESKRISQLPEGLSVSLLTSYLVGNSTIYKNDNRLKSDDIRELVDLLLKGYSFDGETTKKEIDNICKKIYSDKEDASELLLNKFKNLPKTHYLVEEINYCLKRQKEFITKCSSNVNIYFLPNLKPREAGGKFYNCYLNRADYRDLKKELPLNLNEIIPPNMDMDAVEWYIQEHYDPTFKLSGGIILKMDETIGNVTIFKPNDGKIGVSPIEKEKLDSISDLDSEINSLKKEKELLENEIKKLNEEKNNLNNEMENVFIDYENKAIDLQNQLVENIWNLREKYYKQKVKKYEEK